MDRERLLPERVREAIDSGKLPARKPDRILGGLGTGKLCAVCGAILTLTQMEIEVEFDRSGTSSGPERYRAHPRCFAAWELELRGRSGGGGVDGIVAPGPHALPAWSPGGVDRSEPRP